MYMISIQGTFMVWTIFPDLGIPILEMRWSCSNLYHGNSNTGNMNLSIAAASWLYSYVYIYAIDKHSDMCIYADL